MQAADLSQVAEARGGRAGPLHHAVLWAVIAAMLAFAWTGFMASDDAYYASSGVGWAHGFPYVADHFATARALVGIAIAPFVRVFGERELAFVLSTSLFFAATMSVTLQMLSRLIGAGAATPACAVMSTLPLFALKATIPGADMPELFFVAGSLWLFWLASRQERRFWLLVGAGTCAGLAFSAHEISSALVLCYGVLFLAGFAMPRRDYWLMAIGFLLVVAIEAAYYAIVAGDPLRRFSLLLSVVSSGSGDRVELGLLERDAGGSLHVSDYIDPLLMFFTRHEFGLLGFAAVPALWWACVTRRAEKSACLVLARMLAVIALVWSVYVGIQLRTAYVLPRYYLVPTYCLAVMVALWAYLEIWPRRPRLAVLGAALMVSVNLAAIYVDNRNPMFGVRALVEYLGASSGPVRTDPMTAHNAAWYCRWAKVDCSRVTAGAPEPGDVYFYNPRYADEPNRFVPPRQVKLYRVDGGWPTIWSKAESRKASGVILERVGLDRLLPAGVRKKLDRPNPPVKVLVVGR